MECEPDLEPEGILDALHGNPEEEPRGFTYVFSASLVELSADFKTRLIQRLKDDKRWKNILEEAAKKAGLENPKTASGTPNLALKDVISGTPGLSQEDTTSLPDQPVSDQPESNVPMNKVPKGGHFVLKNELLYHVTPENKRLVIPHSVQPEIFKLAHGDHHAGLQKTYQRISRTLYVRNLASSLKKWIQHCPECQLHRTRRHLPYGDLQPIITPPIPFHTITLDFVLALPVSIDGYECLLTIMCKFSKRIALISGKSTWSAEEWAVALLLRLQIADWGLPSAMISDRDPKFMSDLWKAIFEKLGTKILASTAYHPQADGQSERTNQTVEIALRFLLSSTDGSLWPTLLPALQAAFNNDKSATGRSPNEVIYGFKVMETPWAIRPERNKDLTLAAEHTKSRSN